MKGLKNGTKMAATNENGSTFEGNKESPELDQFQQQSELSFQDPLTPDSTENSDPGTFEVTERNSSEVILAESNAKDDESSLSEKERMMDSDQYSTLERSLTTDILKTGLSTIGRTLDTFEYAFTKLDLSKKGLINIDALYEYPHLRLVFLRDNHLDSVIPLAKAKYLTVLDLQNNLISSFDEVPKFKYLQALNLRQNRLTSTNGLQSSSLQYLDLSDNKIEDLEAFGGHNFEDLWSLEMRNNKLTSLESMNLPNLQILFVPENRLKSLTGLEKCPKLYSLHARNNLLDSLEGLEKFDNLEYFNVRDNKIDNFEATSYLGASPRVYTAVFSGNPIADDPLYRTKIISQNKNLKRLDKDIIKEADQIEGTRLRQVDDKEQVYDKTTIKSNSIVIEEPIELSQEPGRGSGSKQSPEKQRVVKKSITKPRSINPNAN